MSGCVLCRDWHPCSVPVRVSDLGVPGFRLFGFAVRFRAPGLWGLGLSGLGSGL